MHLYDLVKSLKFFSFLAGLNAASSIFAMEGKPSFFLWERGGKSTQPPQEEKQNQKKPSPEEITQNLLSSIDNFRKGLYQVSKEAEKAKIELMKGSIKIQAELQAKCDAEVNNNDQEDDQQKALRQERQFKKKPHLSPFFLPCVKKEALGEVCKKNQEKGSSQQAQKKIHLTPFFPYYVNKEALGEDCKKNQEEDSSQQAQSLTPLQEANKIEDNKNKRLDFQGQKVFEPIEEEPIEQNCDQNLQNQKKGNNSQAKKRNPLKPAKIYFPDMSTPIKPVNFTAAGEGFMEKNSSKFEEQYLTLMGYSSAKRSPRKIHLLSAYQKYHARHREEIDEKSLCHLMEIAPKIEELSDALEKSMGDNNDNLKQGKATANYRKRLTRKLGNNPKVNEALTCALKEVLEILSWDEYTSLPWKKEYPSLDQKVTQITTGRSSFRGEWINPLVGPLTNWRKESDHAINMERARGTQHCRYISRIIGELDDLKEEMQRLRRPDPREEDSEVSQKTRLKSLAKELGDMKNMFTQVADQMTCDLFLLPGIINKVRDGEEEISKILLEKILESLFAPISNDKVDLFLKAAAFGKPKGN